jgi:hypothetical protein
MLCCVESRVGVLTQKAQHVCPADEIELARLHGFNRQLVAAAGNNGVQTQYLTCFRDANNQRFAIF